MRAVNISWRGKVVKVSKLTDSPCIINRSMLNFLHSGSVISMYSNDSRVSCPEIARHRSVVVMTEPCPRTYQTDLEKKVEIPKPVF